MTYLEAAAAILREAGTALHYREIAQRAIEKGLITPTGKTPHAPWGLNSMCLSNELHDEAAPERSGR